MKTPKEIVLDVIRSGDKSPERLVLAGMAEAYRDAARIHRLLDPDDPDIPETFEVMAKKCEL